MPPREETAWIPKVFCFVVLFLFWGTFQSRVPGGAAHCPPQVPSAPQRPPETPGVQAVRRETGQRVSKLTLPTQDVVDDESPWALCSGKPCPAQPRQEAAIQLSVNEQPGRLIRK